MQAALPAEPALSSTQADRLGRGQQIAVILVITLFFVWGVANNLNDVLIQQFKSAFTLSDLQAGLVQSAFYTGYFVAAIPAAMFMRSYSYKVAIVLGLALFGVGALLFLPAADALYYPYFLGALFIIAFGLTFLETAANPFMAGTGAPEAAARRLNFAQAFNPLGSITGVLIGREFIFGATSAAPATGSAVHAAAAHAVKGPYLVIGLLALAYALVFALLRFPQTHDERVVENTAAATGGFRAAWVSRRLRAAVVSQFFYVGAQVGIWSYLIRYALVNIPGTNPQTASDYLTASLVLFLVGRFAGTALMKRVEPARLMAIYAAINIALTTFAVLFPGEAALYALVASSFFMSIMYPTNFVTGIEGLGSATKAGASFMVMAIIGGAALTAAMGHLSDATSIRYAFAVPALCFVVILLYALSVLRAHGSTPAAPAD